MVEPVSEVPSFHNVQPCYGTEVNRDVASSGEEDGSAPWNFSCNIQMRDDLEVNHDGARYLNKDKLFIKDSSICNTQQNKTQDKHMEDCFKDERKLVCESLSNSQPQDEKNPSLHAQDENDTLNVQNNLIGVREKLKETDKYKHAAEEEWAARQLELQHQAEEAQQLRKRKKAEALRLLDIERRQKQRVEEMREIQKKDEETVNLKEQLRVEVRRDLDKLEVQCTDMASLLRGLGIHVRGGFFPMPHEVLAAYKQALF